MEPSVDSSAGAPFERPSGLTVILICVVSLFIQALDRGACLFTYEDTMVNFQLEDVTCTGNFAGKWGGCFSLAEANFNVMRSVFENNQVCLAGSSPHTSWQ
jgi:hypothetical protein